MSAVQKLTGGSGGSQFRVQAETLKGTDRQIQTKRDAVARNWHA